MSDLVVCPTSTRGSDNQFCAHKGWNRWLPAAIVQAAPLCAAPDLQEPADHSSQVTNDMLRWKRGRRSAWPGGLDPGSMEPASTATRSAGADGSRKARRNELVRKPVPQNRRRRDDAERAAEGPLRPRRRSHAAGARRDKGLSRSVREQETEPSLYIRGITLMLM